MKKKIIKHAIVYLGAVLAVAALWLTATLYSKSSQKQLEETRQESMADADQAASTTRIKTCKVFYQPLKDILKLPGTVEAYEDIDLAAKTGGTIEKINFEEGDRVKKDEKLLMLDVDMLNAQYSRAKTAYDLAQNKFKRMKDLYEKKVTSKDSYDDADANLKTAKAVLEEAKVALNYGTLKSPINGILDRRYVDPGEHIDGGQTIMKIVDIDRVKIILNIPEKDILYFKPGQEVTITVSNGEERKFAGKIEYVALTAEAASRTYPLKVVVDNSDYHLRPGMIVRVELVRREIAEGIAVPFFALVEREDGKSVFVVEDGVSVEKPIEYGMFQGGMVEITSGLEIGDQLVLVGQRNLVNGETVSIAEDLTDAAKLYLSSGKDLAQFSFEQIGK